MKCARAGYGGGGLGVGRRGSARSRWETRRAVDAEFPARPSKGFSEGTHHVGRCVFFPPLFSGRRVSGRAFCDDADAGVSRNSEGVSPEPSNRVARDLWRGVRSLRRGSVCARRRPASSGQPHHHTDCFGFQPRPNAGGANSYGQRDSECTFQVLQLKNQGLIALLSLKSIVEPFFSPVGAMTPQSNARASNRRRVAHPRSPPRPDFVQPALVSE